MIKHGTKNFNSVTVRSCCRTHLTAHPFFISQCLFQNETITLWLTNFYFKQKDFFINLTVSQYFRPVVKMGTKPGKTFVIVK